MNYSMLSCLDSSLKVMYFEWRIWSSLEVKVAICAMVMFSSVA